MAGGYVARILNPQKIHGVLTQTPLFCGDHGSALLSKKTVLDGLGTEVFDATAGGGAQDYLHLAKGSRISWFDLRPEAQNSGKVWLKMHIEQQQQSASLVSKKNPKNLRPIFYLPYQQNRTTRMKLGADPGYTGPDVTFFATATVNGCSVYVEGSPAAPKVSHSNASAHSGTNAGGDSWAVKLARAQAKSQFMDQRYGHLRKGPTTVVERANYVAGSTPEIDQAAAAFARTMRVPLTAVYKDTYNPIGAVVGLKHADGNWKFWVQSNVDFGFRPREGGYKNGSVVFRVQELWPNGGGHYRQI